MGNGRCKAALIEGKRRIFMGHWLRNASPTTQASELPTKTRMASLASYTSLYLESLDNLSIEVAEELNSHRKTNCFLGTPFTFNDRARPDIISVRHPGFYVTQEEAAEPRPEMP